MLALAAALFLRMLGVFIILPVAAPLVLALPDGSRVHAGLVLGGYGITQALTQIPIGILADRFGKKRVMLAALAVYASGSFIAAAADSANGVVMGRLLQGAGAMAGVATAWVADTVPAARRTMAMAALGIVIGAAFMASVILSPLLLRWADGIGGIFFFSGWLGVAAFALVAALPPPPAAARGETALLPLLKNPALQKIGFGAFALHYTLATLFFVLPLSLALPPESHWQAYAAGLALALPAIGVLIRRVDANPPLYMSLAVALMGAATLLLFNPAPSLPAAVLLLALFFAGFSVLEAALPAQGARLAAADTRATVMGGIIACKFLGVFCGGAVAGALSGLAGQHLPVGMAIALLGGWLALLRR